MDLMSNKVIAYQMHHLTLDTKWITLVIIPDLLSMLKSPTNCMLDIHS